MKIKKINSDSEKNLITGMITSDHFLSEIISIFDRKLLQTPYSKIVSDWCIDYFKKYNKAPKNDIQEIFKLNKDKLGDDEEVIETFLHKLSERADQLEKFNDKFILDESEKYLAERKLLNLSEIIKANIVSGNVAEAELLVAKHNKTARPESKAVDVINDKQAIIQSIHEEQDVLFELPGAVGNIIGPLCRGDFFAFLAPMKRGKCLSGDSNIILSDGRYLSLKNVIENKLSNCISKNEIHEIVPATISNFYKNGIKPVYEIKTKTGRKIKITSNHPLYVFGKEWQSIDDGMKKGDYIAVPKNIPIFGDKKIPDDHVKLIAYLLADGGLTSGITFTKKDAFIKNDFNEIIIKIGDKIRIENALTVAVTKGFQGNEKTETKKLLIKYRMKFCKSIEKEIPECVFTLPKKQLCLFLKILFSCDGSVFPAGIEYSSGSEIMINQIQHLLLRFGIVSKLSESIVNDTKYYRVSIKDTHHAIKYVHKIGFISEKQNKAKIFLLAWKNKKQRSLLDGIPGVARNLIIKKIKESKIKHAIFNSIVDVPNVKWNLTSEYLKKVNHILQDKEIDSWINKDILFDEIISISYSGEEETFDITVPKYHNFIANDICAHNTWWLEDFAIRGAMAGLKVLFVSMEMPKNQMLKRIYQYFLAAPRKDQDITIPYFTEEGEVKTRTVHKKAISSGVMLKKSKALNLMIKSGGLRLICYPAKSASVKTIKNEILMLSTYEGFYPDIIVVDYADILAPEPESPNEYRHKIDHTWVTLRGLAQEINGLVITASQSSRASFSKDIEESDIAEDIRKLAHVTHMVSLNQKKEEKEKGIMRVSVLASRSEDFTGAEAVVLYQYAIGKAILDSRDEKDTNIC